MKTYNVEFTTNRAYANIYDQNNKLVTSYVCDRLEGSLELWSNKKLAQKIARDHGFKLGLVTQQ